MNRTTLALVAASVLSAGTAPVALAQDQPLDTMQRGISMLEASVGLSLRRFGVDIDPQSLTLQQLATIHGILSGSESEGRKRQRVREVVANS